jgi:3'-phosphoadenosine 5'-phosphosulfate sulfotransferase (PAPS reductase)/FAD synthetase
MSQRIVCWFSCGAASAVATKLAIEENLKSESPKELIVASIFLKNEHPDSERFKKECAKWFGVPILDLKNEKYNADVDTVIQKTRYMSGVRGARCTKELKKQVRLDWQKQNDIHVFGMTSEEENRIDNLIDSEPELELWAPLIDKGYTKPDCFRVLNDAGIELPEMYKLGYHNNNCIGCLKASGAGYWNKIRVDFPDVFERRAKQEEMINVALVKISANKIRKYWPEVFDQMKADGYEPKIDARNTMRIPLRYLPKDAGNHKDMDIGACGFFCEKPGDNYTLDL